jgi:hypothetical protein
MTKGKPGSEAERIAELEAALDRQEADLLDVIAENEELRAELASVVAKNEAELRVRYGLHLRVAS